ncbi:MAG TPA: hypothetical protein VJ508_08210 [Saprospiraceae bacterium]|nr:hypothetical protein [Saprospiraceae bacterium]
MLPVIMESETCFEEFEQMLPGRYPADQAESSLAVARIDKDFQGFFALLITGIFRSGSTDGGGKQIIKIDGNQSACDTFQ